MKEANPRSATGLLAKFYKDICATLGINFKNAAGKNSMSFNTLMERWLNDPVNSVPQNTRERQTKRTNVVKVLVAQEMSWNTFIMGLKFINVSKFDITVTLYHKGNLSPTVHKTTVITDIDFNEGEVPKDE